MTEQENKEQENKEQEIQEQEITEAELKSNEVIEQAYKVEMQSDIPDLWDRIEAALPEKTPSETKVRNFHTIKLISLIAACLCVLLMIPTILSIGGHRMTESAATASEEVADTAAESEMMSESEATTESETMSESEAMDSEMTEEVDRAESAMAEDSASAGAAANAATAESETSAEKQQSTATEESLQDTATNQAAEERNDYGSDALYTEHVKIEIIECDTELGRGDEDGYCTYTIMVLEDTSGIYEQASIFDVYVDEIEIQTAKVKAGDQYEVTLVNPDPLSSSVPKISMLLPQK